MNRTSQELYRRALRSITGGVNSPVRSFASVGGEPRFFLRGQGAWVEDVDGNRLLDMMSSWGALLLGHAAAEVVEAVQRQAELGTSFGAPTEAEVELAELLCAQVPALELVRMVNSGTEATMSAIRLARAATRRDLLVKFNGCYHGHADSLLVEAGSGALDLGVPSSPGVPKPLAELTLSLPYNNTESLQRCFAEHSERIACVIVEPVACNMNLVMPTAGFLAQLRQLCDTSGALLIFDEVITGFRVGAGGAQAHFGVKPDLVSLGKVIGGGLPVGAYGGREDLMRQVAPLGPVYQAGTLSGNPLAVAVGLAVLKVALNDEGFYQRLEARARAYADGLQQLAESAGVALSTQAIGGMFGVLFAESPPANLEDVQGADHARFKKFFHAMLEQGVYLPPSAYEVYFVSAAHGDAELAHFLKAAESALRTL